METRHSAFHSMDILIFHSGFPVFWGKAWRSGSSLGVQCATKSGKVCKSDPECRPWQAGPLVPFVETSSSIQSSVPASWFAGSVSANWNRMFAWFISFLILQLDPCRATRSTVTGRTIKIRYSRGTAAGRLGAVTVTP